MYRYTDLETLHVEITTGCNAACPMCPRNVLGERPNLHLPAAQLLLDDVQRILPPDFVRQLRRVYLCGNYGDPIMAADTLDVLAYMRRENPNLRLGVHTNGSGRAATWWTRLAGLVDYCRFGIDGLADTNAVYRRNTDWTTILESVRAFVAAGGRAEWDYLVFQHNEHQVEEARQLAAELGFSAFYTKATARFFHPRTGRRLKRIPILNRSGRRVGYLEPPLQDRWQNSALADLDRIAAAGGYRDFLRSTPIYCKVAAARSLYLSAEGLVFPCCWLGGIYPWFSPRDTPETFLARVPGGRDALDARRHGVRAIVNGPLFQEVVPAGWLPGTEERPRIDVCARTCGMHDLHGRQLVRSTVNESRGG